MSILTYSIIISRIIPGTRLPTYLGAGHLKYPLFKFLLLTIASVFFWVILALFAGRSLQELFMDHIILTMVTFLIGLQFLKALVPKLMSHWNRTVLFYFWRKWTHFEFWPAWLFYLPIVPYYIYLPIKHGGLLLPFYVGPGIVNGGLIGESKWEFLKHLKKYDSARLQALKIKREIDFMEVKEILEAKKIQFPFIMKPDIGQRGFGVRVIQDDFDLTEYLLLSDFERIIQKRSVYPNEAGIFYIRKPSQSTGIIFSITDKRFPEVVGDGETKLGNLILRDKKMLESLPLFISKGIGQSLILS